MSYPRHRPRKPGLVSVQSCLKDRIQPLVAQALRLHQAEFGEGRDIHHDGILPNIGRLYQIHISGRDRSWLRVGTSEWELNFDDMSRYQSEAKWRRNGRFLSNAWGRQQPGQPIRRPGLRAFVIGANGKRHTELFLLPDGTAMGTRTELGLTYDCWRRSRHHRWLVRREQIIRELKPFASDAWIAEHLTSWWPGKLGRDKPRGMWRTRFYALQEELRWDRPRARSRRVFRPKVMLPGQPLPPVVRSGRKYGAFMSDE